MRVLARVRAEPRVAALRDACMKDCCPSLLIGTWNPWRLRRERGRRLTGEIGSDHKITVRGFGPT